MGRKKSAQRVISNNGRAEKVICIGGFAHENNLCLFSEGSSEESELQIPRVRLTGHGRMPVVDMSKINAIR